MSPVTHPVKLVPYQRWLERTSWFAHPRSLQLKELDQAIQAYERSSNENNWKRLGDSLEAWKRTHGPNDEWKRSERNRKDAAVEELSALYSGKGDTDKARGQAPDFMHPALSQTRLGVIYLFSQAQVNTNFFNVILEGGLGATGGVLSYMGAEVKDGGLGNSSAGNASTYLAPAMVPGNILLDAGNTGVRHASDVGRLIGTVEAYFTTFIASVWETIKEKFGNVDPYIAAGKNILNICLSVFAKAAAPFVSSGMDIAKGVVNTLDACYTRWKAWNQGKGVAVLAGHPGTIVESIKIGMNLSICEGLYQAMKGAVNMGMAGVTAGASMIVSIVIALAEMVIKLIWRMAEMSKMNKFFSEAAEHWEHRHDAAAIHTKPFAFGTWFRDSALLMPALSVLTLNSGICGDKMHFLQMYSSAGTVISQSDFDRGCVFIDSLKVWGSTYLGKCGYNFSSADAFAQSRLQFATTHFAEGSPVWSALVKVANA